MEPDDTQAILYYVQHLATLLSRQSDQVLQEQLGIGLSQFRILQALQTNPLVQQKQIASLLGQTEASVSRQINLLQTKGTIAVRTGLRDRREHIAVVLPKGERLLEAGLQLITQYHRPMFEGLKLREREQLLELLGRLHADMCMVDGIEGLLHMGGSAAGGPVSPAD
jgi:DNA-binding MarR family transcriptional regulator